MFIHRLNFAGIQPAEKEGEMGEISAAEGLKPRVSG